MRCIRDASVRAPPSHQPVRTEATHTLCACDASVHAWERAWRVVTAEGAAGPGDQGLWQNERVTKGPLPVPAAALGSAFTISLVAAASWFFQAPMLAPPLGATALLCVIIPRAHAAAPRNTTVSHVTPRLSAWLPS